MTPKLIAVAGPLRGIIFELTSPEIIIGRDPSNQISLADRSLSRKHCLIKHEDQQVMAIDLESRNGTFVNDVPIKKYVLKHGDRIRTGGSHFLVLLNEEEPQSASNDVEFESDDILTNSITRFRLEDALFSMARDLNALMKVSSIISSIRLTQPLQKALLDSLFEIVPAERGVILLADESLDQPKAVYATDIAHGRSHPVKVSRTLAAQVLNEGLAILSNDVIRNPTLGGIESLIASQVHSLLCVPLVLGNKVIGLIYLDTSRQRTCFDESHLRMVTMIAGIATGALVKAADTERLEIENRRLYEELSAGKSMIGESAQMKQVYEFITKAAPQPSTVLILGESGTGKELVARAIHNRSPRAAAPFIAVNCASLNEALLESDLFGHEKGAFTGAVAQKKGKLEAATGGTLFLDEVGEMSPNVQAKLLRVLQDCEFERVGGIRSIRSDVRVIAATNRDLKEAVSTGAFRQDLYYRLNVVQMTMPPLRRRPEDIPLLANYFIAKYSETCKRSVSGISPAARRYLVEYEWPGNVRELENAIERAVVLGSSEHIELEDLPDELTQGTAAVADDGDAGIGTFQQQVYEAKRKILLDAVEAAGNNYAAAARLLGVHPNNLHRLMRSAGLGRHAKDSHDG
jgi:transcriptional regulator with GAF, ATPase, and Fis domain